MIYSGLTGGLACGKSYISSLFAEKGCKIIDADAVAHTVMLPGESAYEEVKRVFGPLIVKADGTIDRGVLRSIVAYDREKLHKLEEIVHPAVAGKVEAIKEGIFARSSDAFVIYNAPLIYETAIEKNFDCVILVHASFEKQLERIRTRGSPPYNHAKKLIAAQMPLEEKVRRADYVIDNSGSAEDAASEVDRVYRLISEKFIRRRAPFESSPPFLPPTLPN